MDCPRFFYDAFYGVSYTDYLFSLPMGAGKTYLMAAFIYLDLYYASREPDNPAFAHNFMIFAPSGLKSSVIPSLKTIQNFNPAWVLPEPAASEIKRLLHFEVLDQQRTGAKDNKTKNPNVQKIANHQPYESLFGLVAVTNAEKVILDRLSDDENKTKNGQMSIEFPPETEDEQERQANELRNLIGKLPSLSVFIDEVHHAVSSADQKQERKLRGVVNGWAKKGSVISVIGFSGTPYLEKSEKIRVSPELEVSTAEITNTVYYYPLIDGVGNFLKRPILQIAEIASSIRIINNGVREFLNRFKNKIYLDGTTAKLGIYCGTIEKLEERVFPVVMNIIREYGLREDAVLKFHRGNKEHPIGSENQMLFDTLDHPESKVRIVLLVQIGKEGWDCRSLTGIILSQEGDCPRNMVLQTACRCLRQVDRGQEETALIYLNRANADKMQVQLQKQHHISLNEFTSSNRHLTPLKRYDRTETLRIPTLPFYQLRVHFETSVVETAHPSSALSEATSGVRHPDSTKQTDFKTFQTISTHVDEQTGTVKAAFFPWLCHIAKSSFGTLPLEKLEPYQDALRSIYHIITWERDGTRYFNDIYDRAAIEANIRKAFSDRREFEMKEEIVREDARLLAIEKFKTDISVPRPNEYYPNQEISAKIVEQDKQDETPDEETLRFMQYAEKHGMLDVLETLRKRKTALAGQNRSFHYLPYHMDSKPERDFLKNILPQEDLETLNLEVYYNGDSSLTEFQLDCYKRGSHGWRFVGQYTPDFLILQRRNGEIYKVLIVETKGELYAPAFQDRKLFAETEFLEQNERAFGYRRFEYLYIEGSLSANEARILDKIHSFFERG